MNLDKESFQAEERASEVDTGFGEIDFLSSDTIKDVLPETLRSGDEDVVVESGVREKDPDKMVVRGTIPSSTIIPLEIYRETKEPAVMDVESAGFAVKKVPEWEMRARGTIKTDGVDELPPFTESIINDEKEQKAA